MSAPFVQQLRSSRAPIVLGGASGAGTIAFRVEAAELWDAVRVTGAPGARVIEMKQKVVEAFFPGEHVGEFVLKLRGWEILDENATLADAGIGNGSIVLLGYRRRRPVR